MRRPRFTFVSDGNPLRRLLVISKLESSCSCVLCAIRPPGLSVAVETSRRYAMMKLQMGKGRRGITPRGGCSTIELLPHVVEQVGLEPTTDDNPQLRPIK